MAAQQFCLRWNNHQPNFISVFSNLLSSESLVDVTLAAEGKHVQAHKVVLSACSSYFQSLFAVNPCQHPIVILKDIKYSDLKTMIDFMYCGEVNVSQEQLPAILKTAETLKVKGLAEMPDQNIFCVANENKNSADSHSPSMLRRKRLRKSSTGSGSGSTEQTTAGSEDMGGSGVASSSPLTVKAEALSEGESSLRHEPSTDSEHGLPSQDSVEDMSEQTGNHSSHPQSSGHHPPPQNQSSTSSDDKSDNTLARTSSTEDNSSPSASSQTHFSTGGGWGHPPLMSHAPHYHPATAPPQPMKAPRAPHRRRINPQQSEAFREALEAVRQGRVGFCKAAKTYGVNNRTLWLEYKRLGYPLARQAPKHANSANSNSATTSSTSVTSSSQERGGASSPPADRYTPNAGTSLMPTSYFDPGYPFNLSGLQPVNHESVPGNFPSTSSSTSLHEMSRGNNNHHHQHQQHNRGGGPHQQQQPHHLLQLTSAKFVSSAPGGGAGEPGGGGAAAPPSNGGGGGAGAASFEYFDSQ